MRKPILFSMLILAIALSSCRKNDDPVPASDVSDYSSQVVFSWVELTLRLSKETPGFSPPVTARVYGYTGLALYECVRPGMTGYKSMEGQVSDFTIGTIPATEAGAEYHWGVAANATLGLFLKHCFRNTSTENLADIAALERNFEAIFRLECSTETYFRSIAYGRAVAKAMLVYTDGDGQTECFNSNFPASYAVTVGTGLWEPTSATTPIPLQPYWGDVRTFLAANVSSVVPIAPPAYSTDPTSAFYLEAMEVYDAVNNLTAEQRKIAEFWSDDPGNTATPPGHSFSIMLQVLKDESADLARTAEVFAKLGMGLHDAFVSCWKAKYVHNLIRPITYVHRYIDNSWTIPLSTPPFPEYTSGHSVQSGAAARILTDLFGENYAFEDRTHAERTDIDGAPRSYTSFYHFADEAAISRLYGGIHYRAAIDVGVEQGKQIGTNIGTLQFK